jgi:succinate-semialdehyde dehydrogenase/glutarate-semialdehyde dehydrogenase
MTDLESFSLLRRQAFIGGAWVDAKDGAVFDVLNPATGAVLASVPDMGASDTESAIAEARDAMPAWAALPAKARSQVLRRWYDLIMANQEELARLLTAEMGKPLTEARGEVAYGASFIEWFAEEGRRVYGDVIPSNSTGSRITVIRQPVGVVAAITPWNFPIAMITRKAGPALAAGCSIVVKPAEDTPLSALAIAALAAEAGVPAGVLNIVTTRRSAEVGETLTASPVVRKLSFTGSTRVGKILMAQCAATVKKVSLELGGNAPFIVFDDADLDAAVEGAMASKFRNAGQTCVCANRILVQSGVHDAFVGKLAAAVRAQLKVGDGALAGTTIGPLINEAAAKKVNGMVSDALAKGAVAVPDLPQAPVGPRFVAPAILTGVGGDMDMLENEIFGPVAPIQKFETEADAIWLANDTPFGLSAYFYARDYARITRVSEALEAGIIGINEGIISTEVAPFGGVKESGLGREGSRYGIEDYLEMKYLCLGGLNRG